LKKIAIVPTSAFVTASLKELKLRVFPNIYPTVDVEKFKPISNPMKEKIRKECNVSSESFAILYVGNLNHNKGLHELLYAMWLLSHQTDTELRLLLALDMPINESESSSLLSNWLTKFGIKDQTQILGIVPSIAMYMACSDVVVIPFQNTYGPADPPLSILEAMACGTTVLTTDVGGISEIIDTGENGVLVERKNPLEISKWLLEFIENRQLLTDIGQNAPRKIQTKCSSIESAKGYESVYNKIIGV
jgi:glycosyltransferase involved in cell wall biosynthesis